MAKSSRPLQRFWGQPQFPLNVALDGRVILVLAVALGLAIGLTFDSGSFEVVVTSVFVGGLVLLTLRFPLEGLLLTLILHPFENFFYLSIPMRAGIPDLTLTRVVIALLFMVVVARGATGQRRFLRLTRVDVMMLLTGLTLSLAALRSEAIISNLQWVFDVYLTSYALYYIAKNLVTDRVALRRVLWAAVIIGAYNGLYGIYTQLTGDVLFVEGDLSGLLFYSESLRIMRGLLDSPHVFGLVFSLAIPVGFYLFLKTRGGVKLLILVLLLLAIGGLFFTYKRTAWIATLASLLILPLFFPRFRVLLITIIAATAFVAWLYADQIESSAVATERVGEGVDTLNGRLELWNQAWGYFLQEPILGYGLENFHAHSGLEAIESHYLQVLLDAGLVGFVPFVLVLLFLLRASVRLYRARATALFVEPDLAAVFWGIWIAYIVSLSTVVMNHEFPHQLYFLLAGAIVGSQEQFLGEPRVRATSR